MEKQHTKLSSVMFTDIVGYSAISNRDFNLGVKIAEENLEITSNAEKNQSIFRYIGYISTI